VLFRRPALVAVTFTAIVQELLMATVPLVKLIVPDPAVAVSVPPQVFVAPAGVATTIPAGRLSVNATPVSTAVFAAGFVMVKVNVEFWFSWTVVGEKLFAMVSGATTIKVALLLVPPGPLSVALTTPVVLTFVPALVPVTLTMMVQEPLGANVPPLRLTVVEEAAALSTPPQVLLALVGKATTKPAGRLSLNCRPVNVKLLFELVMLNVSDVTPFNGMLATPKALVMEGPAATVKLALAVLPVPPLVELTVPVVLV
jgi:hypothetical protein